MKGCKQNPSWYNKIPKELKINKCYHTLWQSHSGMRFILVDIVGDEAILKTKASPKTFKSKLSDLRDTNRR